MTPYQPVWRDGQQVGSGERASADRYAALRPVLVDLDGPFDLLDVGAYTGYFSVRASEDFDCDVTAIDDRPGLPSIASERVGVIDRRVDAGDLERLPRHDVVLALSVLHHFREWALVLDQLRACRRWLIAEVPHPDEDWMRHAASRHEVGDIHDAVSGLATATLGSFERRGFARPMYLLPGTVTRVHGTVFTGSGSCSQNLARFSHGLADRLGYQPYMGSLNLRLGKTVDLGEPYIAWVGRDGPRKRDYQFWRAWHHSLFCHAMVPGRRGHGPDAIEMVAPVRLRDRCRLADGDVLPVDVEVNP